MSTGTDSAWAKGAKEDMMTIKTTKQNIITIKSTTDEYLDSLK